jgi:hypothetical protein
MYSVTFHGPNTEETVIEQMNLTFNSEDISFIYGVAVLENFV